MLRDEIDYGEFCRRGHARRQHQVPARTPGRQHPAATSTSRPDGDRSSAGVLGVMMVRHDRFTDWDTHPSTILRSSTIEDNVMRRSACANGRADDTFRHPSARSEHTDTLARRPAPTSGFNHDHALEGIVYGPRYRMCTRGDVDDS